VTRRRLLRRLVVIVVVAGLMVPIGARMGMLTGRRPDRLGVVDGRLQPVRAQFTNAVSSTATTEYHRIEPLAGGPSPAAAFARLRAWVAARPEARLVDERPGYLHAEFTSKWLRFVDDVEFLLDEPAGLIHVRSASRLGRKDFGVNRARIEAARRALASG
jgi:uncharacterized protein (DUF1499 family)